MNCPSCGHGNRERAKFCEECAAPLPRVCPSCGVEPRPRAVVLLEDTTGPGHIARVVESPCRFVQIAL